MSYTTLGGAPIHTCDVCGYKYVTACDRDHRTRSQRFWDWIKAS